MNQQTAHDADVLNELLGVCREGESLHEQAASAADDRSVKQAARNMSDVHSSLAETLSAQIARLGEKPREGATISGRSDEVFLRKLDEASAPQAVNWPQSMNRFEQRALKVFKTMSSRLCDPELRQLLLDKMTFVEANHKVANRLCGELA